MQKKSSKAATKIISPGSSTVHSSLIANGKNDTVTALRLIEVCQARPCPRSILFYTTDPIQAESLAHHVQISLSRVEPKLCTIRTPPVVPRVRPCLEIPSKSVLPRAEAKAVCGRAETLKKCVGSEKLCVDYLRLSLFCSAILQSGKKNVSVKCFRCFANFAVSFLFLANLHRTVV